MPPSLSSPLLLGRLPQQRASSSSPPPVHAKTWPSLLHDPSMMGSGKAMFVVTSRMLLSLTDGRSPPTASRRLDLSKAGRDGADPSMAATGDRAAQDSAMMDVPTTSCDTFTISKIYEECGNGQRLARTRKIEDYTVLI